MIRQLLATTLHPKVSKPTLSDTTITVAKFPAAAELGAQAAAYSGCGLDLYGGECVLAGVRYHDEPNGYRHTSVLALTNRRTIVGGYSSAKTELNAQGFAVAHDELMGVDAKDSMLKTELALLSAQGKHSIVHLYAHCKDLERLYKSLLAIPVGSRGEPPTAAVLATADDPTGARGAMAGLWSQDGESYALLQAVDAAVGGGSLSAADGLELAGRIVLWHRSRLLGAAGYGTAYLSPLSAEDLGNVLTETLGQPAGYQQPHAGSHVLSFRLDPRRDALSPALSALGIASYLGLGVGFSPGKMIAAQMFAKPPFTDLRIAYGDVQGGCSYEMYAHGHQRIEAAEAAFALGLHQVLIHRAPQILSRRIAVGWGARYAELF